MIRLWRFLGVCNLAMAFVLAYSGNEHYLIPFVTAAYCGYQLECQKEKENKHE